MERRATAALSTVAVPPDSTIVITLKRYCYLAELIRVTAFCQHFLRNVKSPTSSRRTSTGVMTDEFTEAERLWFRQILCARLVSYVKKNLVLDAKICHCWNDTKIVLVLNKWRHEQEETICYEQGS
ncbi:hypothetical protein T4E_12223 [Trichinella pseudospiralis]|uniref:Uncharacterized protein n=1 Tax=Trichinella pseudospiralis TaxID=6337 RepID=A0A0V0XPX9_TRIPS|nr:hypothetical protein T4E_12223 [Trichinella pseudospiralis]